MTNARRALVMVILCLLIFLPAAAQATLNYGQPVSGTLGAGEKDTYTFNGKQGEKPVIAMNMHGGNMLPYVALYDPAGNLIGEDSQGGPKGNALLKGLVLAADGLYTVEAANRTTEGDGEYSLVVNEESLRIYFDGVAPEESARESYQLSQPWDHTNISYSILNTLDGFNPADVRSIIQAAFQAWAANSPLTFTEVQDRGDISVQFDFIDGQFSILGQACPPYNPCDSGSVIFDAGETWALVEPQGYGDVSLLGVATHEFGHALGLLHTDDPNALMYPEYSPYILQPAQDDVAGLQRLYGVGGAGPVSNPPSLPGLPSNPAAGQMQVSGELDDQQFAHFWDFNVVAGDTVTIDMQASEGDLDSLLVLIDANDNVLAFDDDSGGGRDAQLAHLQFPQGGTYTVAATRYAQAQGYTEGTYILSIAYDVGPPTGASSPADAPGNADNPSPAPSNPTASVQVSAGDPSQIEQLPSLDSALESSFAGSATPVEQSRNGTVDPTQAYAWEQVWCATDADTLAANLPDISVTFRVNGEPVDPALVTQRNFTMGRYQCNSYSVILSDWSTGQVNLSATLSLAAPVFDGTTIYPAGDYVYTYVIQAR
ncbi:MAG: matrixin family metalloprotease [Anaerolineae bacterium]|nr:matrixin family metalloprotease [Anaerolineae bacterium]